MAKVLVGSALIVTLLSVALPAFSQSEPSATADYPNQGPTSGASPSAPPPSPAGVQPASQTPAPGTPAATSPATAAASPAAANPSYPPAPQGVATNGTNSQIVEPPPPPPKEERPFEFPDMSVRVDPLNWIIYGRLGIELEAAVWKIISVEIVPVFVTSKQPPFMNLGSFPANMYQASNGLGALSGASIGAGFWLNRRPFEGTVLRVFYTNYGYRYTAKADDGSVVDEAAHTDRRVYGFLGSHSKWGPFTIATGIGLGVELNRERRCIDTATLSPTTNNCKKDVFDIQLIEGQNVVFPVYKWLHPAYLDFRLSLGFVF